MGRKFYLGIMLASLLAISLPSLSLAALDSSYWSTEADAIDYDDNTITHYVDSVPSNPWEVSWGKGQGVRQNKKYVLSFDARADGKYDSLVEISIRLQKDRAPWTYYSDEKIINLDGTRRHYEVEMWSDTDDAGAMLTVWTGYEAGDYEFYNIYLEIGDDGDTPDSHPLDYSWWSVPESGIDHDSGIVEHSVPSVPSDPWATQWGKNMNAREDKKYILRFDASAWSYSSEDWVPIKIRLQKNYSPWTYYSEEKTIYINDEKHYYEVELYSSTYDDNAIVSVWTSVAAAEYEFSRISLEIKVDGTDPPDPPDGDSLDASWWSNRGGMDHLRGTVVHEVKRVTSDPSQTTWGKDQGVRDSKVYVVKFDAKADSYTSAYKVPISLRFYKNSAPWTRYTTEKTIELDGEWDSYEVKLFVSASDAGAALGVYNGHAAAKYFFNNISLEIRDPHDGEIPDKNPLDPSYWSNQPGAIDFGLGQITHEVEAKPANPWDAAWGKDSAIINNRTYVLKFDARAENSTYEIPVKAVLYVNHDPWTRLAPEKEIKIGGDWDTYLVEFNTTGADNNAALAVWTGFSTGLYEFNNISFELK